MKALYKEIAEIAKLLENCEDEDERLELDAKLYDLQEQLDEHLNNQYSHHDKYA